uniref:Nucleotid_trans domain-containing protein n=1 Tax=Angiostrongylus cantonensis TaxID=6313 RepID=A0A0K0DG03_ANGCA
MENCQMLNTSYFEYLQDLSDGPLVLKEGVAVGRNIAMGKNLAMSEKAKESEKKQNKLKKRKWKNPTKHSEPLPTLDKDFIKKFAEVAKEMSLTRHLLYITVVNGAFERLTINWLCNTLIFKELTCMFMRFPGYEGDLNWGEQKYINFLTIRTQLMRILIERLNSVFEDVEQNSVRFVLIEADSTWFRDPLELFINATMIDDADIVVPSKGYTRKGDDLAFSPILVEPTNTSIAVFDEMNRRLLRNDSLYDQDVLNELCSMKYHGVVCRSFEYSEIADGKWFHLHDRVKSNMKPFIVNNNFYVGLKNKETRQVWIKNL